MLGHVKEAAKHESLHDFAFRLVDLELKLVNDALFNELAKFSDQWLPEGVDLDSLVVCRLPIL